MKKLITFICLLSTLILTGCSSNYDSLSIEIDKLKEQVTILTEENNNLKKELAQITANKLEDSANKENNSQYPLYEKWVEATNASPERYMYENIINGFLIMDDEMSRGWIDDGTVQFLRFIKGSDLSENYVISNAHALYNSLDIQFANSSYSLRDFFCVDEYNNPTNTGIYNFLETINQLEKTKFNGKDIVFTDTAGNITGYDLVHHEVANALGISEELVEIILCAASDAGFH